MSPASEALIASAVTSAAYTLSGCYRGSLQPAHVRAPPAGLEPATSALVSRFARAQAFHRSYRSVYIALSSRQQRSIQLSYGEDVWFSSALTILYSWARPSAEVFHTAAYHRQDFGNDGPLCF